MEFLKVLALTIFLIFTWNGVDTVRPFLYKQLFKHKAIDVIEKAGANSECSIHLKRFITDLLKRKSWALQMLDSSAKVQTGILTGNLNQMGNFDECLDIHALLEDTEIVGQYCTVVLMPRPNFTSEYDILFNAKEISKQLGFNRYHNSADFALNQLKVVYGLCIPKSCTIGSLQKIWTNVERTFSLPFQATFTDVLCTYKDKGLLPSEVDKYSYAFFAAILIIVALSTFYDVMVYQHFEKHDDEINIWVSFSLYTNFKKIFSYNSQAVHSNLGCLNGIKVFSMLWVILGHRCLLTLITPNVNAFYIMEWQKTLKSTFFQVGTFSVDTFFVLSGFLIAYGYAQYTQVLKMKISWPGFYFYRFLRLSPSLTAMILFYISILKHFNDGPLWPIIIHKLSGSCKTTWWATTFFFSNSLPWDIQCVEQSWYLAVDTQLYFISPIILIFLFKKPKKTAIVCTLLCISSSVYAFYITYHNRYGANFVQGNKEYQRYIYQPTFIRMPSWMTGLFLGWLILNHKDAKIPKRLNIFLWLLAVTTLIYILKLFTDFSKNDYNPLAAATYNALARPIWSLMMSLIIFLCVSGHGGSVNVFLSHPVFSVLAKLSYSIFLVHLAVMFIISGGNKSISYFSCLNMLHQFVGDTLFVFIASTIWCLIFESPFINIGKLMYKRELMKNKENKLVPYNKKLSIKKKHATGKKNI